MQLRNMKVDKTNFRLSLLFILIAFANCNKIAGLELSNESCLFKTYVDKKPAVVIDKQNNENELNKATNLITIFL